MPKLELTPTSLPLIKLMMLGYSGEGKSGSLVPLGIPGIIKNFPGYELRVLDFDGKFEELTRAVLGKYLAEKKITQDQHDTALTNNFDICLCTEATSVVDVREAGKNITTFGAQGTTTAWAKATRQIRKWERSMDESKIFIVDSLTFAAKHIAAFSQELQGKLNKSLMWQDYQFPQQEIESLLDFAADCKSHSIILGHQDPMEIMKRTGRFDDKDNEIMELMDVLVLPIAMGKANRPKLPARFNHMLMMSSEGTDSAARRCIWTIPHNGIMCKSPFFSAKDRYEITKGMPEYFSLRGTTTNTGDQATRKPD